MAIRNLDGVVAERNFDKEGNFNCTILNVTSGMNKKGTAEQDVIFLQSDEGYTGNIYLTYIDVMMPNIKGQLQTLGVDLTNGFDPAQLVGMRCTVNVKFQVETLKDEWGNVTGTKLGDMPNIRFTSQSASTPTTATPTTVAQAPQPAVAPVPQQQEVPIVNPLDSQPVLATPTTPTTIEVQSLQPEAPIQGLATAPTTATPTTVAQAPQPAVAPVPQVATAPATAPAVGLFDPNTGQPIAQQTVAQQPQLQPQVATAPTAQPQVGQQPTINGIA